MLATGSKITRRLNKGGFFQLAFRAIAYSRWRIYVEVC